jgi:hypothetical protein
MRPHWYLAGVLTLSTAVSAFARMYEQPRSFALNDRSQDQVERKVLPGISVDRLLAEDRAQPTKPRLPAPRRFAVSADVAYTLKDSGVWQNVSDGRLWRLRIQSPGSRSINLGITRFEMPDGAKLWIYDPAHMDVEGPYTARDRSHLGSLWTPLIDGEEVVVEVFVPTGAAEPVVEIHKVNQGYKDLGKAGLFGTAEGTCENDVVCPAGNPWQNQINAVGVYTINGNVGCTGTMVTDTAFDGKPYILSANHCGVDSTNDATIVIYWNYQSAMCGTHGPGSLADNQTGATYRASYATSDFLLFELNAVPNAAFHVQYAGWDATGAIPASTVGIHHPELDVKAISFSNSAPDTTAYYSSVHDPNGTHWRVLWNSGVTEEGSSGSCLFETTNHRCIGQLHGGPSACGGADLHDYYGRLSVSWNGGGTASSSLKGWLDPLNTGTLTNDGDPHITTAGGTHYNFQGAGEYVSLRKPGGTEIQTRQAPIATTFNPGPDPYDGVATCVSLNTAFAARVAGHRVSYEPNLNGVPDPSGLQLRIDGMLTSLSQLPRDLGGGARIARTFAPGGLQIDFGDLTTLLVTPGWWSSQGKWYLNVDVVRTPTVDGTPGIIPPAVAPATPVAGIMGPLAVGSWLPALPDGTSMGPMPGSVHQRYLDLYQRFGNAWRVSDANSLFDYAPGTSTGTFTLASWPPENPPCTIPGVKPVQPVSLATAQRACSRVTGTNAHADCVFDVQVTGNLGFAGTDAESQGVVATGGTGGPGPGPTTPASQGRMAVFLDLGAGFPHGTFGNSFNTGFSLNAGFEYMVNNYFSAEGIFGYHHFPGKLGADGAIYQISANGKVFLVPPSHTLRPFVNAGAGAYVFSPGSTKFGGNAGGGMLYSISPRVGIEGAYNFHVVNTPGGATQFSTVQGGIRLVF